MEKHLYVVVGMVPSKEGGLENLTIEIEATGRVDAKFKFPAETGFDAGTVYILAVYGPYERSK